MALTYQIHRDIGLVVTTGLGRVSLDDALQLIDELLVDPDFDPSHHRLLDYRGVTAVDDRVPGGIREFSERVSERTEFTAAGKTAIVTPQPAVYGVHRMFQTYAEGSPRELEVFTDLDEARRWLDLAGWPDGL